MQRIEWDSYQSTDFPPFQCGENVFARNTPHLLQLSTNVHIVTFTFNNDIYALCWVSGRLELSPRWGGTRIQKRARDNLSTRWNRQIEPFISPLAISRTSHPNRLSFPAAHQFAISARAQVRGLLPRKKWCFDPREEIPAKIYCPSRACFSHSFKLLQRAIIQNWINSSSNATPFN